MFTKAKKSAIFCWNTPCLTRSGYKCHKSSGKAFAYIKVLVDKSFLEILFLLFFYFAVLLERSQSKYAEEGYDART